MSKRERRREQGMFDGLQDAPSLEESSDAIFGSGMPITPTIKIKLVELDLIQPDPMQPRRAIPSVLRDRWKFPEQSFVELFMMWLDYMGENFDLEAYLLDGETDRAKQDGKDNALLPNYEPQTPEQISFMHLLELASSILREGLTNPISISRVGRDYMIETGERRWLAYHLLNMYFGEDSEEDWSKIPARIMPERSVWRQATENNVRQNLNAISRTRQLAILLMDIFGWENFRPMTDFEHEQDFYAQVSDGTKWRIPKDKTEQLLKAMGFNNQTQIRQYRTILRVEPRLWRYADDVDMPESAIRHHPGFDLPSIPGTTIRRPQFDRVYDEMGDFCELILKYARSSEGEKRLDWLEFAQQQVAWWSDFARKLDE